MTTLTDDDFVRLFQERAGLNVDGWAGKDTLAKLDALMPPPPSAGDDLPEDYWPMLSKIESNDRPFVKASTSSASGLYQFIKSTWLGEGGAWGGDRALAFGGLRPPVEEQLARAKTFTAKNAAYLQDRNIPINRASLYAAHFLGPVTAAALIGAEPDRRADWIVGEAATRANRSILEGKTVGQFLSWLHRKTGEWAR
ncbi:peptidoglycan-binding domain-containing protein [Qipengyuania sp.]|uniref:peptidoglycan-binding domain-containing protein n=1 Tax=Qipengyuania sp. TaxID=2004515 RepID=UPI0035C7FA8B